LESRLKKCNRAVAWVLDLHSYLLGDEGGQQGSADAAGAPQGAQAHHQHPVNNDHGGGGAGLGAAHQALLLWEGPTGFQP
jgi:hypothetical protein